MKAGGARAGYDVAVIGAGIVGLACALAAARTGKRVAVIDRETRANGASVRNFGFITVTGQQSGDCWRRAMRTRDVWSEVAPQAGIEIVTTGLNVVARRPEARAVLEAFAATPMGAFRNWRAKLPPFCAVRTNCASNREMRFPDWRGGWKPSST